MKIEASDKAINKLYELREKNNLILRILVTGGGCAGFQYQFILEDYPESLNNDEFIFLEFKNKVKISIDKISLNMIDGATLDFEESLSFSKFILRNPNITLSCGCGNSFSP